MTKFYTLRDDVIDEKDNRQKAEKESHARKNHTFMSPLFGRSMRGIVHMS